MRQFDVLVIGAGINGVGVAQAAAAQGYKVRVLEKHTMPGQETSAASSKLIHGGLRYLESMQLSLVRESLQEREWLLKQAPDLVQRLRFNIPIYHDTHRSRWTMHAGLSLYALLAGLQRHSFYHQVPSACWSQLEGLKTEGLMAVFQYQDAQTDDTALTQAVMASAQQLGAELQCGACFLQAEKTARQIVVRYQHEGKEHQLACRVLVNAAGPWVHSLNGKIDPVPALPMPDLIQGAHLSLATAVTQAYYLEAPQDQRAVFLLPWKGGALLGTTETVLTQEKDHYSLLPLEQEYLQTVYDYYFPSRSAHIVGAMAGVRVLAQGSSRIFNRGRDVSLQADHPARPRIVTIIGGKLTVYRRTANKVMRLLQGSLPATRALADTAKLKLSPVTKRQWP